MATVNEITLKYAARGAKAAQRADNQVRDSVQETAKTARQESGEINRWMQRHQAAILGIAAATTGAMAAIISASPTLSAQLSAVRMGFSLLAMTIGEDVAPILEGLGEKVIDLADWYADLPDPIRTTISTLVLLAGILGTVAFAAAALQKVIAGTLVAGLAKGLVGAIASAVGSIGALIAAKGGLIGILAGVGKAIGTVISVLVGLISIKAILIGAVIAFAAAFIFNVGGVRDKTIEIIGNLIGWLRDAFSGLFTWLLELTTGAIEGLLELWRWFTEGLGELLTMFGEFLRETFIGLYEWLGERTTEALTFILELWGWFRESMLELLTLFGEFLRETFTALFGWLSERTEETLSLLIGLWGWYSDTVLEIAETLATLVLDVFDWLREDSIEAVSNLVTAVVARFTTLLFRVTNLVRDIRDSVTSLFLDLVSRAFNWGSDLINEVISGVQDRLSAFVDTFANAGTQAAQALADKFNEVVPSSISIPSRTISIPSILGGGSVTIGGGSLNLPQLAEGGIVDRPTIAMIGEGNQSEAVIPLDRLDAMLSGGSDGGGQTFNISFEEGAIVIQGTGDPNIDLDRLVRRLKQELGREFGSRAGGI